MDLRPYAPAAEAHENFSYAFVKNGFCKNETLHKYIFLYFIVFCLLMFMHNSQKHMNAPPCA